MRISVIITCYNRESSIERCLRSVLDQDYPDLQTVVVDDGSADGSLSIIRSLEAQYRGRMTLIAQANAGVAMARNAGLAAADGDYVTFLDSDDYMLGGALEAMASAADDGADQVLYDAYMVYPDGRREIYRSYHDGAAAGVEPGAISPSQLLLSNPCPWNRLIRRQVYERAFGTGAAFPKGLWYEDLATIPLLSGATGRAVYLSRPLIAYCQSEDSIMRRSGYNAHYDDIFKVADRLRESLGSSFPEETEYLIWEHLLVSAGKRYLACGRKDLMKACGRYMKDHYPDSKSNMYVGHEPLRKRVLARLIAGGRYGILKVLGK